jgi:hypothetical protein
MIFTLGDILIKIDCRATADTQFTRHHVMLVLGTSATGNPIVAHMMGAPHCKLITEELTRGKDLQLIHYDWPDETRNAISQAIVESCRSSKFILTDEIIQEQRMAASFFKPTCHLEVQKKLQALETRFHTLGSKFGNFIPNPEVTTVISCHEWVFSVIHYACKHTNHPAPQAFRIPPNIAWADFIHNMAKKDKEVSCSTISVALEPKKLVDSRQNIFQFSFCFFPFLKCISDTGELISSFHTGSGKTMINQ